MNLTGVTITGAADETPIKRLLELQISFPYLELGILLSKSRMGEPRYPGTKWLHTLFEAYGLRLSAHVCGIWTRQICMGGRIPELADPEQFSRLQLNIGQRLPGLDIVKMAHRLKSISCPQEVILQTGGREAFLTQELILAGVNASFLFDGSGGRGIHPERWPQPLENISCGYAGGIGPGNIAESIKAISAIPGETSFWIDMETGVMGEDDRLDLAKVETCLSIAEPFITR